MAQQMPSTPDEVTDHINALREEWRVAHIERMRAWEHFQTREYQEEVTEWLLSTTHADMEPPWLRDPTEQDNAP